jgi:hypothetical protein
MVTHAAAIADLAVGPPLNNCQGELELIDSVARNGTLWSVLRCPECGKNVLADALRGFGERFTEEPQQVAEEPKDVKTPVPAPAKRGRRKKAAE